MIVILCKSYFDAIEDFRYYLSILMQNATEWIIQRIWYNENCVETDDDLRYIFVDYRYRPLFEKMGADFITSDEFFEDIQYLIDRGYIY